MWKLILVPLIPVFVMLVKSSVEDYMRSRKERPQEEEKRTDPKVYDHKWPDDD